MYLKISYLSSENFRIYNIISSEVLCEKSKSQVRISEVKYEFPRLHCKYI